ncbi:MAG: radical SAM family heme chaperone HemW [Bacteroidales bacterium]|nr:radical SAM family heme chaperone HemW [Bacteroidales bacterium]
MSGIYIHIPFCRRKCLYCAFYSVALLSRKQDYLDALHGEIEQTLDYLPSREIATLYLGGGTPTLLSANELESIIRKIRRHYDLAPEAECTIEANPEQLNKSYLKDLLSLGINRLSIGVQSFNNDTLHFLGRRHSAEEALEAVNLAATAGFDNISIDLIYGISQRQHGEWEQDVHTAMTLPVNHLSCYALTNEENTLLWRKIRQQQLPDMDDELAQRDFTTLLAIVREHGFEQYEISNFARNGMISKHNSAYWNRQPYLGLGPSAHSFNGRERQWNVSDLNQYLDDIATRNFSGDRETLSLNDQYNEYVMLGLRTAKGIDLQEIASLFGLQYSQYAETQLQEVNPAHYRRNGDNIVLTDEGKFFADGIAEQMFN